MDISKAINILADSVYDLKEKGRYNSIQRRNHTVDFYGYEFPRWGCSSSKPAVIGMSISQDLIYYERFEFKLVIDNFYLKIVVICCMRKIVELSLQ